MPYDYKDSEETAAEEYNDYDYTYIVYDEVGNIIAITASADYAKMVANGLNAIELPHDKE